MSFGAVTISSTSMVDTPRGRIHLIDPRPRMPVLRVESGPTGAAGPVHRRFRLEITYDDGRRFDHLQVPADRAWQDVPGPVWIPNLGGAFAGGEVMAYVEADLPNGLVLSADSGRGRHRLLGVNPTEETVRRRLADEPEVASTVSRTSRFTQFSDASDLRDTIRADPAGPLRTIGPGGVTGYGIGALPDTSLDAALLWDWTANLDATVAHFRTRRVAAQRDRPGDVSPP